MGIRIHQLPTVVANQIAAGEVIERPASVIKELLENSLDASATAITVEVSYGGLNQIKISDNDHGIVAEDLPLAIAAHATSKITKLDDLYAIGSMGFRGEALASIASIAKLTISSKPAQQEHGMMLEVKGEALKISPCPRNTGTTIDVVDLFYNAPVRKRSLKSEKLEFQAIEMVFKRFALSAPGIALTLKHNGKLVLTLPAAASEQTKLSRMTKIFGSSFIKDAIFLDVEHGGMRLYGWISGPTFQRSQNDRQWIYINQRMVKDKLINHALKQAYEGLLHPGRFPAYLLYFNIEKAEVDVNVHPTKHEVRFQQPRLVHDFFTSQLAAALHVQGNTQASHYEMLSHSITGQYREIREPYVPIEPLELENVPLATLRNSSPISDSEGAWIILNKRYVLVFIAQQPYIMDVIAAQQQWLLGQLKQLDLPLESRPLLVPINYLMPDSLQSKTAELQSGLLQLGMQTALQKEGSLLIRSMPIRVPHLGIQLFLDTVAKLPNLDLNQMLLAISQAQVFDPRLLSTEERWVLNQTLILPSQEKHMPSYFKALSPDYCRMLLDA